MENEERPSHGGYGSELVESAIKAEIRGRRLELEFLTDDFFRDELGEVEEEAQRMREMFPLWKEKKIIALHRNPDLHESSIADIERITLKHVAFAARYGFHLWMSRASDFPQDSEESLYAKDELAVWNKVTVISERAVELDKSDHQILEERIDYFLKNPQQNQTHDLFVLRQLREKWRNSGYEDSVSILPIANVEHHAENYFYKEAKYSKYSPEEREFIDAADGLIDDFLFFHFEQGRLIGRGREHDPNYLIKSHAKWLEHMDQKYKDGSAQDYEKKKRILALVTLPRIRDEISYKFGRLAWEYAKCEDPELKAEKLQKIKMWTERGSVVTSAIRISKNS